MKKAIALILFSATTFAASVKDGRTYAIIRWNPGFDRAAFLRAKSQGIIQTSFDTARKNLAGTEGIVSWRGLQPIELSGKVLSTHSHVEMLIFLSTNSVDWERPLRP